MHFTRFFFFLDTEGQRRRISAQLFNLGVQMGDVNRGKSFQTKLPKQNNGNPTNLLLRFSPEKPKQIQLSNSEPHLDLNLRLSLGGVYSEHFKENPITRSSSVAGVMTKKVNAGESNSALPGIFLSLTRSCSLPVGSEQGHFRLKDLQVKRMEAQKRLLEKQRRCRATPEEEKSSAEPRSPLSAVPDWAVSSAAQSATLCRALLKIKTEGYVSGKRKHEGIFLFIVLSSYTNTNFSVQMNCDIALIICFIFSFSVCRMS
jgi:hypothetical protein